jgi:hypothetical protein
MEDLVKRDLRRHINIGVHVTHCCHQHGCKYSNVDCPVLWGTEKQKFRCEMCQDVWEERGEPACGVDKCNKPGFWKWVSQTSDTPLASIQSLFVTFFLCDEHDAYCRVNQATAQAVEKRVL